MLEGAPSTDIFGAQPKGVLILTREGRMAAIITAENRKSGTGDAERAALHESVISYSGKYRVEGKEFVTAVDMRLGTAPSSGATGGSRMASYLSTRPRYRPRTFPERWSSLG